MASVPFLQCRAFPIPIILLVRCPILFSKNYTNRKILWFELCHEVAWYSYYFLPRDNFRSRVRDSNLETDFKYNISLVLKQNNYFMDKHHLEMQDYGGISPRFLDLYFL